MTAIQWNVELAAEMNVVIGRSRRHDVGIIVSDNALDLSDSFGRIIKQLTQR